MTNGSLNSYRFNIWLPLFAALLIAIPIFIWIGYIFLAKLTGVVILVLLIYAMRIWFKKARLQNQRLERVHLNANDLFSIQQLIPSWKTWPNQDRQILVNQLGLLLAEVEFRGAPTPKSKLLAGILIVAATLNDGYTNKQGWICTFLNENEVLLKTPTEFTFQIPTSVLSANSLNALQHAPALDALKTLLEGKF
ncbi:MAG: hypothetical protein ACKOWX_09250 [Flavobacteriales bacterium]